MCHEDDGGGGVTSDMLWKAKYAPRDLAGSGTRMQVLGVDCWVSGGCEVA